jgi:hypothetical protein
MTVVTRTDVLSSLQAIHGDVQRRAAELDRYRALKAIEQTIADFPGLDDVTRSLGDVRDRVQQQLDGTREFRALRTIERILPELSEVLGLWDQGAEGERDPGEANGHAKDGPPIDGPSADICVALEVAQTGSDAADPRESETAAPVNESEPQAVPAWIADAETRLAETAPAEPDAAAVPDGAGSEERPALRPEARGRRSHTFPLWRTVLRN